jgi:hypothetical protein
MTSPGLAPVLARFDAALDALGPEGARRVLRSHLEALPPSEREKFVAVFETEASSPVAAADLLGEIDQRVKALSGMVREVRERDWRRRRRWDDGWDDELDGHPLQDEVDELHRRVGERFLAGEWATAVVAYRRLLDEAVADIDVGYDEASGISASDEVQREAVARLVRALLSDGVAPIGDRVHAATDALVTYQVLGAPSVGDILDCHPDALPAGTDVLRAWLPVCEAAIRERPGWEARHLHQVVVDLVVRLHGGDALARLARDESYSHRVEALFAWLDNLEASARLTDATAAAAEVIASLRPSWDRARVAERLAATHRALDDRQAAAEAQLMAFEDRPGLGSLAWLCHDHVGPLLADAKPDAVGDTTAGVGVAGVADRLRAVASAGGEPVVVVTTAALTGNLDDLTTDMVLDRLARFDAAEVATGALLLASGVPADGTGARLARRLLDGVDRFSGGGYAEALALRHETPPPPLAPCLEAAVRSVDAAPERLDQARGLLDATAEAVLGRKARGAYAGVARQVVAYAHVAAETVDLPPEETIGLFDQRYRRFSAFRSELRTARKEAR